jgi:hypothetical protein
LFNLPFRKKRKLLNSLSTGLKKNGAGRKVEGMSAVDEKAPPPSPPEAKDDVEVDVERANASQTEKHPDDRILKHSHDADEAMKAFSGLEGQMITIDEATNKRLLRIIDWHLMPLMCVVYGMNFLDSRLYSWNRTEFIADMGA